MKTTLLTIILCAAMQVLNAQDCAHIFFAHKHTGVSYHSFDRKNKYTGKDETIIKDIKTSGSQSEGLFLSKHYDKKDKLIQESEYNIICANNTIYIDLKSFIDPSMLEAYKDMDMTVSTENIDMPANMRVGQTLPDAQLSISVSSEGIKVFDMVYVIRNRNVVAQETITTPAGSFDTYKISYEIHIQTTTLGIPISRIMTANEWWSHTNGFVKSEVFNRNGRLFSTRILHAIF
jgi:hypothetical protein